jgi:hypothetical protein
MSSAVPLPRDCSTAYREKPKRLEYAIAIERHASGLLDNHRVQSLGC